MSYCIIDIDGTLANCDHRLHHLKTNDWNSFFEAMTEDTVFAQTAFLLEMLHESGYNIVLCSGRPDNYQKQTLDWLYEANIVYDYLFMRPSDDNRADYIVKREMLKEIRNTFDEDPFFVIDDREQVVKGCWLEENQFVLQVRRANVKETSVDPKARLIVMVGPSGAGKSTFLADVVNMETFNFNPSCVISSDQIRADMTGSIFDQTRNDDVFDYLHNAVSLRLRAGMTAVVDATNIKRKDRLKVVELSEGVCQVSYIVIDRPLESKLETAGWRANVPGLIERHTNTFNSNLKDILRGDDQPNVQVFDMRLK